MKDFSKLIPLRLNKEVNIKRDRIKIRIVKKYLFISSKLKFVFANISLFINIFFGLLKESIWLIEYLKSEYIFMNLKPELVEKKDPPMMTKIKNRKFKFVCLVSRVKPIFDILLDIDKKLLKKLLLKLKKRKTKVTTITK